VPLPLAALVALSLGALFAHVARTDLDGRDGGVESTTSVVFGARPLRHVVAFAAFVYLPALAYFTAVHGDWAYMYFVAWRRVPSALDLVLVVTCAALVPVGFVCAAPFARARRRNVVVGMIAVPTLLAVMLALAFQHRVGTSATFVQFSINEDTRPITASGLGRAMLVAITVCAAAALWCVRLLRPRTK
jgi:hypothetical protein